MEKLIEVENLCKEFPIKKGFFNKQVGSIYAVNNINIDMYKQETLGLVGESGCGKSTTGRCILCLIPSTKGTVKFKGEDISNASKNLRSKMQIIFQNPYSSLNPRMTIKDILEEPLIIHKTMPKNELKTRINDLIDMVGLSSSSLVRYPHEFSGGQRQRIGIARSLALNPEFIVCDEPVSALDVSVQAQIINLLEELKKDLGLTYLFISHDLSVIRYICNRVAVMYLGEIIELSSVERLFSKPLHPYTQALLSAIPIPDPSKNINGKILLKGDLPNPANPPSGCKFHTRCIHSMDICKNIHPEKIEVEPEHYVNCHLYNSDVLEK